MTWSFVLLFRTYLPVVDLPGTRLMFFITLTYLGEIGKHLGSIVGENSSLGFVEAVHEW